jgi:HAMP domain-containing protein
MKNTSIRTRILAGVVILNLLGAVAVIVYLHQSFSGGLDVWAQKSLTTGTSTWSELSDLNVVKPNNLTDFKATQGYVDAMKKISGADYGLLLDKAAIDEKAYAKAVEAAGLPNNWNERDNYVLVATSNKMLADKMQLKTVTADAVPKDGKVVGIENGSCTALCHRSVRGQGDYWRVSWSDDGNSHAHVVFPVADSSGKVVGVVYSIEDVTKQAESAKSVIYRTMFAIIATLLVVTLCIGMLLDLWVFKRLNAMIKNMEDLSMRVAGGDFYAKYTPDGSNDEIGKFEKFFERFLDLMTSTLRSLSEK